MQQPLLARKTFVFMKIAVLTYLIFLVVKFTKSLTHPKHSSDSNHPHVLETEKTLNPSGIQSTPELENGMLRKEIEALKGQNDWLTKNNNALEAQVDNLSKENKSLINGFREKTWEMERKFNNQSSQHDKALAAEKSRRRVSELVIQRNKERHRKGPHIRQQNSVDERKIEQNYRLENEKLAMENNKLAMANDKLAKEKEALIAHVHQEFNRQLHEATAGKQKELDDYIALARRELDDFTAKGRMESAEKDNLITEQNKQLAEKEGQISKICVEGNKQLAVKDREIDERKKQLSEKDIEIVEGKKQLSQKDGEIDEAKKQLAEKEEEIAELVARLEAQRLELAENDNRLNSGGIADFPDFPNLDLPEGFDFDFNTGIDLNTADTDSDSDLELDIPIEEPDDGMEL